MKKHSFSERFRYRFDGMMARGNVSMVKMLVICTLVIVILLTVGIHLLTAPEERDFGGSFWDALASTVNAWMPYSEDGNAGYIVLTALAAVTGLLFTSILIGIITSAVEEKVTGLKDGNSLVLESGHVAVLGFTPGEYTLIQQLAAAAGDRKTCIVVACGLPRSETEAYIRDNVSLPKNVKVICRTAEAGDLAALSVCSLPACRTVVINQPDDVSTLQSMLAARKILSESGAENVKIVSNVSSASLLLPPAIAGEMNLINVSVNDVIARVIARSCAETGLSAAYADLFEITGGRLNLLAFPTLTGRTFGEAVRTMDGAVPIGLIAGGAVLLNPPADRELRETDGLICWTEAGREISFAQDRFRDAPAYDVTPPTEEETTVVIGCNGALETLLRELPEQPNRVIAARVPEERREALLALADGRNDVSLSFFDGDTESETELRALLTGARHAVLLADEGENADEADMLTILRYIKISDIKHDDGLDLSVTVELCSEKNLQLIGTDAETDLIVAPHIVSMFLVQLADRPQLASVFKELLSNEGSEIHLTPADGLKKAVPWGELRAAMLRQRMIPLGYLVGGKAVMNPPLDRAVAPEEADQFIVISEI